MLITTVAAARSERPDLIACDVNLPGMDGFEVARLMRGSPHTRYTPIIFVSAIAHTRDSVLRGYATGAVDFILKPFDMNVLKAKLKQLWLDELARRTGRAVRILADPALAIEAANAQLVDA